MEREQVSLRFSHFRRRHFAVCVLQSSAAWPCRSCYPLGPHPPFPVCSPDLQALEALRTELGAARTEAAEAAAAAAHAAESRQHEVELLRCGCGKLPGVVL